MADHVKFQCTKCGKKMGVRPEYAGKKVRCSGCQEPIRVPLAKPQRAATGSPVTANSSQSSSSNSASGISLADLAAMEQSAAVQTVEMSGRNGPRGGIPQIKDGKPCPSCTASVKQDAVLCIHCGYNFDNGKQFKTKQDSAISKALSSIKPDGEEASNRPLYTIAIGVITFGLGLATLLLDYDPTTSNRKRNIFSSIVNFTFENIGPGAAASVLIGAGVLMFIIAGFELRKRI